MMAILAGMKSLQVSGINFVLCTEKLLCFLPKDIHDSKLILMSWRSPKSVIIPECKQENANELRQNHPDDKAVCQKRVAEESSSFEFINFF